MPRTRSLAWSELKLGVLTIVALVIAAITIILVMGGKGFFWQRYSLKTRFANVAGLKAGSPVRVAGKEVGTVTDVEFSGDQVDVLFQLNKDVRERVTDRSVATLGSVSLLGEGAVDITPSSGGTPIPEWGYVRTGKTAAGFGDLTTQASEGIDEITKLAKDLREGRGTAGKLLTDERLYNELTQFVTTAGDVTKAIRQGRGTAGRLINDPKIANSLEASLRSLEEMTRRINAGEGSLGSLLKDDAFATSLTGATTNLRTLTDRLNKGDGTAGKLLTDAALYNRLTSLSDRFDVLLTRLNDGQGTAGQLLKDKQLYENMNGVVTDLRALVDAIKKDPKKYLNVKVSIF
jgi:phospholipid/cholesterol/gamma-HCH transport system substrate-binding protein